MELNELKIEKVKWGEFTGKFRGQIKFSQANGDISLLLSEEQCHNIMMVCAEAVVESAREVANTLTAAALECIQPAIEMKGDDNA